MGEQSKRRNSTKKNTGSNFTVSREMSRRFSVKTGETAQLTSSNIVDHYIIDDERAKKAKRLLKLSIVSDMPEE